MTHAELLMALLVERYGTPTPGVHTARTASPQPVDDSDTCALRRLTLHRETLRYEHDFPDKRTHRRMRVVA